jgi:Ca2+-binding RTX toxin-like protein
MAPAGNDTINVVRVATSWCGITLQPIQQNGHFFQIYGGAGDDAISGPNSSGPSGNGNWIFGEGGNDTLYMGPGGSEADGGPGNDKIYGTDNTSDILLGGTGNDTLCEHSSSLPLVQRGGDGFDTACSPGASHGQFLEIEAINCQACGLGY